MAVGEQSRYSWISRDNEFTVEYRDASVYALYQGTRLSNSVGGVAGSIRAVTGEPSIKD